jgi:hypothetical protein
MAYGLSVDGFAFNYGTYSVIETGQVPLGSWLNFYKFNHPDITQFGVIFIPYGVRDTSLTEVRPKWTDNGNYIFISGIGVTTPHRYLVLGR